MFLNKKAKRFIKIAWMVLAAIIILSMILLYSPVFSQPTQRVDTTPTTGDGVR